MSDGPVTMEDPSLLIPLVYLVHCFFSTGEGSVPWTLLHVRDFAQANQAYAESTAALALTKEQKFGILLVHKNSLLFSPCTAFLALEEAVSL